MMRLAAVCLFFILAVALSGCGGGGGGSTGGASTGGQATVGATTQPPATARIVVNFPEVRSGQRKPAGSARADANDADIFRFHGLDASGNVVFGPQDHARAPRVTLENVPLAVVALRVEFIRGQAITGSFATPVSLASGSTVTVDNPNTPANSLTTLQVTSTRATVPKGYSVPLSAVGIFANGLSQELSSSVTWISSSPTVASVTLTGTGPQAEARGVGLATLSASCSGVTGAVVLTVTDAELITLEVSPASLTMPVGISQSLTATGVFSDHTTLDVTQRASWSSADTRVATVSQGSAMAVAVGETTITASLAGGSATIRVAVTEAILQGISVTPANPSLARGLSVPLVATGLLSDHSTVDLTNQVAWSSSDPGRVGISNLAGSRGLATATNIGPALISATRNGVSGSTTVTVTEATVVRIDVTPVAPSLPKGCTVQMHATGFFTDSTSRDVTDAATWTSSDDALARVSNTEGSRGLVTGAGVGEPTVTATWSGVSGAGGVRVTPATLETVQLSPVNVSTPLGLPVQFTATGIYTDHTTQDITASVTWNSSDTAVAAVDNGANPGLATPLQAGASVAIAATDPATGKNGSTVLTVTAAVLQSIAVAPANASTPLGVPVQLSATGTYSDRTTRDVTSEMTWTSSNGTVAVVDSAGSRGLVTPLHVGGPVTITAAAPSTAIAESAQITVTAAVLRSVAVSAATGSTPFRVPVQFTATGTYSDSTTRDLTSQLTWGTSDAAVVAVDSDSHRGLATPVSTGGPVTVTATDPATQKSGSAPLTVTAAVLRSVAIVPSNPSLPVHQTRQLGARGTYSDDSVVDLTGLVTWTSSAPTVVAVDNASHRGLATALTSGAPLTITAIEPDSGLEASTRMTVTTGILPVGDFIGGTTVRVGNGYNTLAKVAVGDFNMDGRPDIVATDQQNKLWVILADPAGGFATPVSYAMASQASTILVADFDRDGKLDLAISCTDGIRIFVGRGDGTFAVGVTFGLSIPTIALANVNGDIYPDIVAVRSTSIYTWLSNGDGTFTAASQVINEAPYGPNIPLLADFNEDGKMDLAYQTPGAQLLTVRLGNGDGTFGAAWTTSAPSGWIGATVGDFDLDGHADVVMGTQIFKGTGDGTLQPPITIRTEAPTYYVSVDLNQDGRPDLVSANNLTSVVSVQLAQSSGIFGAETRTSGGWGPTGVAVGDMNGDGRPEIVVPNSNGNLLLLGLTASGGLEGVSTTPLPLNQQIRYVQTLDFNGDQVPDALVIDPSLSRKAGVALGIGDGTFAPPTWLGTTSADFALAGDVDGDGFADVIANNFGTLSVYRGVGNGTFLAPVTRTISSASTYIQGAMVLHDVDKDGKKDVILAHSTRGAVYVMRGNGDGSFNEAVVTTLVGSASAYTSFATADFDGDGNLDVALRWSAGASVQLLLGNGDGTFRVSSVTSTGQENGFILALGTADFNGDGHADLVAMTGGGYVALIPGVGDGTFSSSRLYGTGGTMSDSSSYQAQMKVADVNGDGIPDVITCNQGSDTVGILYGTASGDLLPPQVYAVGGAPSGVDVADCNGDGRLDVVVGNAGSHNLTVLRHR